MDQQAFEKLIVDVSKRFPTPEALIADPLEDAAWPLSRTETDG